MDAATNNKITMGSLKMLFTASKKLLFFLNDSWLFPNCFLADRTSKSESPVILNGAAGIKEYYSKDKLSNMIYFRTNLLKAFFTYSGLLPLITLNSIAMIAITKSICMIPPE
jgi:hypothetical protein